MIVEKTVTQMVPTTRTFRHDIPDGYEFVRIGVPKAGEEYMSTAWESEVLTASEDHDESLEALRAHRMIVKRVEPKWNWKWPAWLKADAVAMDKDGQWYIYEGIPRVQEGSTASAWVSADPGSPGSPGSLGSYHSVPPFCDIKFPEVNLEDWRSSLIKPEDCINE